MQLAQALKLRAQVHFLNELRAPLGCSVGSQLMQRWLKTTKEMAEEGSCTYLIRRLSCAFILRAVVVLLLIVLGIYSVFCSQQLSQQHRLESPAVSPEGRIRERHICPLLGTSAGGLAGRECGGEVGNEGQNRRQRDQLERRLTDKKKKLK